MKTLILALALVAVTSAGCQTTAERQGSPASPAAASASAAPVATPANTTLVEDIIRLWRANLSEEFINNYIARSDPNRDLTPEDVVLLRNAGVPETLITSITSRQRGTGPAASGTRMTHGPGDSRRWDGLARRNSGIVLLKSRWDSGVLEFTDASLRWVDSKDTSKNVLVPAAQLTEQQLTCLKKAGGNECFEWVVKTRTDEYRFRDAGWRQGENSKVQDLFDFFRGVYPNLISSRTPVDEK